MIQGQTITWIHFHTSRAPKQWISSLQMTVERMQWMISVNNLQRGSTRLGPYNEWVKHSDSTESIWEFHRIPIKRLRFLFFFWILDHILLLQPSYVIYQKIFHPFKVGIWLPSFSVSFVLYFYSCWITIWMIWTIWYDMTWQPIG